MAEGMTILEDVDFIITPGGDEDGVFSAGSPLTVKMDTVSIKRMKRLLDKSTAQDDIPFNRKEKKDWEIRCQTKIRRDAGAATLEGILDDNALVGFSMAERAGATGTFMLIAGSGILEDISVEHSGSNSDISFTIKPYGTDVTVSFSV